MTTSISFDLSQPERIDNPRWTCGWLDAANNTFYAEPTEGMTTEQALAAFAQFLESNHTSYDTAFYLTPTKKKHGAHNAYNGLTPNA
tara:strand:+ start:732 stop:992 length:261 start_codon:yes stop_codon:yes gene_type:complete